MSPSPRRVGRPEDLRSLRSIVLAAACGFACAGTPAFELTQPGGGTLSSSELRGKVVVLAFWATWCVPCWTTLQETQRLHDWAATSGLPVAVLAVDCLEKSSSAKEKTAKAAEFFQSQKLTMPSLLDMDDKVFGALGSPGLPRPSRSRAGRYLLQAPSGHVPGHAGNPRSGSARCRQGAFSLSGVACSSSSPTVDSRAAQTWASETGGGMVSARAELQRMPGVVRLISEHPLAAFSVLAYSWSWLIWTPIVLLLQQAQTASGSGIVASAIAIPWWATLGALIGGYGPTIAALILTALTAGRSGTRQLISSLGNFRVRPRCWGFSRHTSKNRT